MMLFMTRYSFLVVLLLSGCAAPAFDNTFQVSADFDDAQFALIQDQADIMCEATAGSDCPLVTRDEAQSVIYRRSIPKDMSAVGMQAPGSIVLDTSLSGVWFSKTIRHEFGHAFGCSDHLPDGNVMAPSIGQQPDNWTDVDLACLR